MKLIKSSLLTKVRILEHINSNAGKEAEVLSGSIRMGRSLISFTNVPLRFSHIPRSLAPSDLPHRCQILRLPANSLSGYRKVSIVSAKQRRRLCTKAVLSENKQYPKMGAKTTGPIPPSQLIQVVEFAAKTGAEVCFLSLSLSLAVYPLNFSFEVDVRNCSVQLLFSVQNLRVRLWNVNYYFNFKNLIHLIDAVLCFFFLK